MDPIIPDHHSKERLESSRIMEFPASLGWLYKFNRKMRDTNPFHWFSGNVCRTYKRQNIRNNWVITRTCTGGSDTHLMYGDLNFSVRNQLCLSVIGKQRKESWPVSSSLHSIFLKQATYPIIIILGFWSHYTEYFRQTFASVKIYKFQKFNYFV